MSRILSGLLALVLIAAPFSALADETTPVVPVETSTETSSILIKVSDTSDATLDQIEDATGITVTDIVADNLVLAEASMSASEAIDQLQDLPSVSYAEPNLERLPLTIPTNDTYKDRMWAIENTGQSLNGTTGTAGDDIDALLAWNLSLGTSTTVAVIDSGVLYTHPDLSAQMWDGTNCVDENGTALGNCIHGYDFADNDRDPAPVTASSSYSHGTHVAGTIAATRNNGAGTVGIAPSATIMALRFGFDTASEVRAIDFARQNGVKIINASYGGTVFSQSEYDAIQRFTTAGGIFVAAAGNSTADSDTSPTYPAAYDLPGIISVAATDQNDALASFSNYGSTTVDLGAPGVNIASTYLTSSSTPTYVYADGTSMAAPHVAAVIALIESLYPSLSATAVKAAILSGGDADAALAGKTITGKRLNAYGALVAANPSADIVPPVITLTGNASISLTTGNTYTELGATAFDAHDGTTTVTVGGDAVNTANAGTYHVTYDAVDLAGNHAVQVVRTVTVSAPVVSSGGGGGGGGSSSSSSSKSKSSGSSGSSSKKTVTKTVVTPSVPRPALTTTPATAPSASVATPTVAGTSTFQFTRQLSLGFSGADVTALQQALVRLGVYSGPVTGYFGAMTQAGVRTYQLKHGLPQVGAVGPMTRTLLNQGT